MTKQEPPQVLPPDRVRADLPVQLSGQAPDTVHEASYHGIGEA
jgi:hypothetical protein